MSTHCGRDFTRGQRTDEELLLRPSLGVRFLGLAAILVGILGFWMLIVGIGHWVSSL